MPGHYGRQLLAEAVLIAALALGSQSATAATLTWDLTTSYQAGNSCSSCGSFGTVTVSSVTSNEVLVTLQLNPNELFAFGGAGKPLLFNISGNPTVTAFQMVTAPTHAQTSWFSFAQAPPVIMADGTGTWNDAVSCNSCLSGTSGNYSGTLSFYLTAATAIAPSSFGTNTNGLYFASDIGVPNGSGGYFTGDVGAAAVSPLPLPAAAWLLISGLGAVGLFGVTRRLA